MNIVSCPVCKSEKFERERIPADDTAVIVCPQCGKFKIDGSAEASFSNGPPYTLLSRALRELYIRGIEKYVNYDNIVEIIDEAGTAGDVKNTAESILIDLYLNNIDNLTDFGIFAVFGRIAIKIEKKNDPVFQYMVLAKWVQFHHRTINSHYLEMMNEGKEHGNSLLGKQDQ